MRNYGMSGAMERPCGCRTEAPCRQEPKRMENVPCRKESPYMQDEYVVAMAYVPWQYFTTVYETDKALEVGTIFPELDKPFWAGRGMARK